MIKDIKLWNSEYVNNAFKVTNSNWNLGLHALGTHRDYLKIILRQQGEGAFVEDSSHFQNTGGPVCKDAASVLTANTFINLQAGIQGG